MTNLAPSTSHPPDPGPASDPALPVAPPPDARCTIRFRLIDIHCSMLEQSSLEAEYVLRHSPLHVNQDGSARLLNKVPVYHLFRATNSGQRVVAHVHGVFPYFYVKYKGRLDPDSGSQA